MLLNAVELKFVYCSRFNADLPFLARLMLSNSLILCCLNLGLLNGPNNGGPKWDEPEIPPNRPA